MHFSTKIAPQKNWGWKWVLCQNGIYYKFSAVKLPKKGGSLHIFPIWLMAFQHNIMWQRVVQKCHFASFTISPNCPVLTCSGSDSDYDCVALDVRLVSFFFLICSFNARYAAILCAIRQTILVIIIFGVYALLWNVFYSTSIPCDKHMYIHTFIRGRLCV